MTHSEHFDRNIPTESIMAETLLAAESMPQSAYPTSCPASGFAENTTLPLRHPADSDPSHSFMRISKILSDAIYEPLYPYHEYGTTLESQLTIDAHAFNDIDQCFNHALTQVSDMGAAIIVNAPLMNLSQLKSWCSSIGEPMDYTGGTNVRQSQGEGVLSVGTEPPWANVAAHNEMSYANIYPELFVIGCEKATQGIAPTIVGDNALMTDLLMLLPLGEKFKTKGVRYIRNFQSAESEQASKMAFSNWQDVFGTTDRTQVLARVKERLSGDHPCKLDWNDSDDSLKLTYNAPAFEYSPECQRNLCFVSIGNHGYWFRQWHPFNELPHIDRPFHMQFGDGSELSETDLSQMAAIANASSFPLYWRPGTIALLDNRRFTHARPKYELPEGALRKLGVVLLNPVQRQGIQGDQF